MFHVCGKDRGTTTSTTPVVVLLLEKGRGVLTVVISGSEDTLMDSSEFGPTLALVLRPCRGGVM